MNKRLEHVTLSIVHSRADRAGNRYFGFTAFNHATQKGISGTTGLGTESNIRAAEFALRDRWPSTGEPRWFVTNSELAIRQFDRTTKAWQYAGCAPEEILNFIKQTI